MKVAFFWDVAPCSLVDVGQRFGGNNCLHHQGGRILHLYSTKFPKKYGNKTKDQGSCF
jgi:hypothetical protein